MIIVDLEEGSPLLTPIIVLQRDFGKYKRDLDFTCKTVAIVWDYWADYENTFTVKR